MWAHPEAPPCASLSKHAAYSHSSELNYTSCSNLNSLKHKNQIRFNEEMVMKSHKKQRLSYILHNIVYSSTTCSHNTNTNNNIASSSSTSFFNIFHVCLILSLIMAWINDNGGLVESSPSVGVNWGSQASHKLPPKLVVQMLKDNGISKVKLFDYDPATMQALAGSDIEVMVAIPNNMLMTLTDAQQAEIWVKTNVLKYIFQGGVNIKYVAVGNEPFLKTYNGSFIGITYPALRNVQAALNNAKMGDKVKATVPSNADVLSDVPLPSQGTFRADIFQQMLEIVTFLNQNGCPFTINIYPFISLYNNPNFPVDYAFFDASGTTTLQDGARIYRNVFDASYDTLVAALSNAGFPDMEIIVGEIGWPTDGFWQATKQNAQRFNQGFLNHIFSNAGTPGRPNSDINFYLFSLMDEDQKSIQPGNFERHWGIFQYNGVAKYGLNIPGSPSGNGLVNAHGVQYLQQRWCVLADTAASSSSLISSVLGKSITFACTYSDCTSLGYGSSCNPFLDARGNASYAFNQYFQINNQDPGTCYFNGLASITFQDPSVGNCQFIVQLATSSASPSATSYGAFSRSRFRLSANCLHQLPWLLLRDMVDLGTQNLFHKSYYNTWCWLISSMILLVHLFFVH